MNQQTFEALKNEIARQITEDMLTDAENDLEMARSAEAKLLSPDAEDEHSAQVESLKAFAMTVLRARTLDTLADAVVRYGMCDKADRYEQVLKMGTGNGSAGTEA